MSKLINLRKDKAPCSMYGCGKLAEYGIGLKDLPHTQINLC